MQTILAPRHSQKIGDNYVLWFESSNSYIVISQSIHSILNSYLEANDEKTFIEHIQKQHKLTQPEATAYSMELSEFLRVMNSVVLTDPKDNTIITIPKPEISKHYAFGDINITINYSSDKLLNLIHPYLHHCSVEKYPKIATSFDIFFKDELLYLYKNQSQIGIYKTKDFHLLHGKFAMELVASLYNNIESDWLATFHASTICNDKEAIMIIGDSGNGKSTLSALLMAHGLDLLADDFSPMLARDQHLYRFPAAISIKKGAFPIIDPLFNKFNTLEPHMHNSKPITVKYLSPSQGFSGSKKNFECKKIVLVKYSENATSEWSECPPEMLLKTLIPDSWISPKEEHSILFLNWLKSLKFYQLTYSNNDMAIDNFKELFEH